MQNLFSPKQLEFILNSTSQWNIAEGSVRTGKSVAVNFRFLERVNEINDDRNYIVGHTFDTAYRNVVRPMMESEELMMWRPFLSWSGKKLYFKDKVITVLGAKDEGAIGSFQGLTMATVLCDEMTLYPDSIIQMIDSRLSLPISMGFSTCNPSHPEHIIKKWIDKAAAGNHRYYSLHWTLEDNPYVSEDYKQRLKESTSGLFYKRNFLGEWCMAEGAIFDFFDKDIHVVKKPPRAAEYYIAGLDYGMSNATACVIVGVSTGKYTQSGKCMWVEKEYYWNVTEKGRAKTNAELAKDIVEFLEPYGVKQLYIDPSALSMKIELRRMGLTPIDANNDVLQGIEKMTSEMAQGNLFVMNNCQHLISEIHNYVWDSSKAKLGEDAPKKKADHAIDALRYVVHTHKVVTYEPYKHNTSDYLQNRFAPTGRFG